MAGSFSQTIILGNVGKDPEIRTTKGGMKIANLEGSKNRWLMRLARDFRLLAI